MDGTPMQVTWPVSPAACWQRGRGACVAGASRADAKISPTVTVALTHEGRVDTVRIATGSTTYVQCGTSNFNLPQQLSQQVKAADTQQEQENTVI